MHPVRTSLKFIQQHKDESTKLAIGLVLIVSGLITALIPDRIFALILEVSILYLFLNGLYLFLQAFLHHHRSDLVYAVLSLMFSFLLVRYSSLPEWLIRVLFGTYCLCSALANYIQFFLDRINRQRSRYRMLLFATIYAVFGFVLLFKPEFPTDLLLSFFGMYFVILGFRYVIDALDMLHPSKNYAWKRKFRITLPPLLSAFLPDRALATINHYFQEGREYGLSQQKSDEDPALKIMVFTGPKGLQKVGHCCFSYKDIVYSYGNYDAPESGPGKVIGDGCFFNVPVEEYQLNMLQAEKNSIFEYGIHLEPEQMDKIEEQIRRLKDKSYRWYCRIEKEDGYRHFEKYEQDYPSRLHYRTGAKFYKIKNGRFRYYWFLGDNCASFIDEILGTVGADILSMRGFITPGTYYDFLENEYAKAGSPVIFRRVRRADAITQPEAG